MEAEVGTPIEYNPDEFTNKDLDVQKEPEPENNEQYYFPPPQHYYEPPPPTQKEDIFSNLDKTAYIIIFVSFILGFFMGKTMQPVILRPG
ncbi:hypothetical protein [Bathycoccus sp. RCC716 virus 1]|uniref:Uncharacterized protein n=1 Tax=Bathycoccus sp. RCC716 virus 1 TaxID=2530038 RepID=A0A7S6NXL9_9PHYC|nr:hypothetical protein [Bathycoccus sp. RCC716 virus 1]